MPRRERNVHGTPGDGIYKPAWKYPVPTLAVDLACHLVYGAAVAAAFAGLDRALR